MEKTAMGTGGWAALAAAVLLGLSPGPARAENPDALWQIVHDQCVAHQRDGGDPSPCLRLDPRPEAGFAVLKDRSGIAQILVVPTTRVTGVESPALLADGAPNYWAFAWSARSLVEEKLRRPLARDQVALAVNSVFGRSQNQLHIHVDCIRPEIGDSLRRQLGEIGSRWARLATPLAGHPYWARRIPGAELGGNNPFKLLAEGLPEAGRHMERQTLVLTGATFEDGSAGFVLLADHADPATADRGNGEELQDHACALAAP